MAVWKEGSIQKTPHQEISCLFTFTVQIQTSPHILALNRISRHLVSLATTLTASKMASSHEDDIKHANDDSKSATLVDKPVLSDTKSPGVARIEALNAHTSLTNRCFIFFGLFLVAYAYGLDGSLRGVYQPYATAGFETHSTLATIGQSSTMVAQCLQADALSRCVAKCDCCCCSANSGEDGYAHCFSATERNHSDQSLADVFGRVEVILVSVFFYVLGTTIEAVASNVETFAAGAVFYQVNISSGIDVQRDILIKHRSATRSWLC